MFIECYYRFQGEDNLVNQKHYHENTFELIQPIFGSGSYLIDGQLFPMVTGALYLIDAEKPHCALPINPSAYCRNKLFLSWDKLELLLGILNARQTLGGWIQQHIFPLNNNITVEVDRYFHWISQSIQQEDLLTAAGYTLQLLSFCKYPIASPQYARDSGLATQILQFIRIHLADSFTLDDICQHVGISKSLLCHKFKEEVHQSIMDYVRAQRIALAVQLLRRTDLPINAIAEKCGYADPSYFSTVFRQEVGKSPGKYRREFSEFNRKRLRKSS